MDIHPNPHQAFWPRATAGGNEEPAPSNAWWTTTAQWSKRTSAAVAADADADDADAVSIGSKLPSSILRSYVARNGIILADATPEGCGEHESCLEETVHRLRSKKPTPGWEFAGPPLHKRTRGSCPLKLRGAKFHIYDQHSEGEDNYDDDDDDDSDSGGCIWSVGCVYDANALEKRHVESFIRHVVVATRDLREHDPVWRSGGHFSAQHQFAPILRQMMPDARRFAKIDALQHEFDALKDIMEENIATILDRNERLSDMEDLAEELTEAAAVFRKNATSLKRKMKRKQLWLRATYGVATATAVSLAVAVPCVLLL